MHRHDAAGPACACLQLPTHAELCGSVYALEGISTRAHLQLGSHVC